MSSHRPLHALEPPRLPPRRLAYTHVESRVAGTTGPNMLRAKTVSVGEVVKRRGEHFGRVNTADLSTMLACAAAAPGTSGAKMNGVDGVRCEPACGWESRSTRL